MLRSDLGMSHHRTTSPIHLLTLMAVYSYSENEILVGWKLFSQKIKNFETLSKIKIFRKIFLDEQSRDDHGSRGKKKITEI